ncbi:MAG: hypothetical protein AABY11_02010, partial [archaeon]
MTPKRGRSQRREAERRAAREVQTPVVVGKMTRLARFREWARKHKKIVRLSIAGAILAGTLGGVKYYRYATIPHCVVVLGAHSDRTDTMYVAHALNTLRKVERVSVVALENAHGTNENSKLAVDAYNHIQNEFEKWRLRTKPGVKEQYQMANEILSQVFNNQLIPIYAEALVSGLPIRFLERGTEKETRRSKELMAKSNAFIQQAVDAPTLKEGAQLLNKSTELLYESIRIRDEEMREELEKIRDEFRGEGTVFSSVGAAHYEFPPTRRVRKIDALDMDRHFLPDPRIEMKLEPEIRAARGIIAYYIRIAVEDARANVEKSKERYQ